MFLIYFDKLNNKLIMIQFITKLFYFPSDIINFLDSKVIVLYF